ncbi:MAG TPA: hypothetical protein VFH51_02915 [Myxococcota bacterium]|nr:hypothetical protein [Myxococcota bacterium]
MTSDAAMSSIEQAVRAVVRAVGQRHAGSPEDCASELDAACVALTGCPPATAVEAPLERLLGDLRHDERLDALRVTTLAHVLAERAAALEREGDGARAVGMYERALRLYDEATAAGVDPSSQATIDAQVRWILKRLPAGSRA